jgi:hypothetical protein
MDCEGAETTILADISIRPRCIIVETHGNRDEVRKLLTERGYDIVLETPAETRVSSNKIREWGLYTIVAEFDELG